MWEKLFHAYLVGKNEFQFTFEIYMKLPNFTLLSDNKRLTFSALFSVPN